MRDDEILPILREAADAIRAAIVGHERRGYSGVRETQYHLDIAADEAGLAVLHAAGFCVVSEESGVTGSGDLTVVIDPIDGSTNCDRGVPFYASSFAVLKNNELVSALVVNQATGTHFEAVRGGGSTRDGKKIAASSQTELGEALVAFSGWPKQHLGWSQIRALGAASLECCLVADGSLDVYAVAQRSTLHPWDYLGGLLIAREAGAVVAEYDGNELITTARDGRRPLFASSQTLLEIFLKAGTL